MDYNSFMESLFPVAVLFCVVVFLYFLPTWIALGRKHRNSAAIVVLNIFLGWTFLGWVIALIWAFTDNTKEQKSKEADA